MMPLTSWNPSLLLPWLIICVWSSSLLLCRSEYMSDGGEGACALMQCFPTLPLPPLPFPSSSSLLCTVDDSDPGQSSETWGERLVAPCRIYAGNHDRPTPSLVSSTSRITHSAPLCCYEHTSTSVFFFLPCICPVAAHACLCLAKCDYWSLGGWRIAVYTWLAYENVVFLVPLFKTSHLLSVSPYADTRGGDECLHCM